MAGLEQFDIQSILPVDGPMAPTDAPVPLSPADQGKRFAYLIAGVILIAVVAENFQKIKALPRRVTQDKKQIAAWSTFLILLYAGFIYQPESDDPSITVTFGAGIQLFSFILLWVMPRKVTKAYMQPSGDSAEFALLTAVALGMRLSSTCRFQGYLPTDMTGDGCYQMLEGLSVLIALRGLSRIGLEPNQGLRCVAVCALCGLFSLVCYGDLDRRPFWDRVYATAIYVEVCSWAFISYSMFKAGADRTIQPHFFVPAITSACCRATFWFVAMDEMHPRHPTRLMAIFPMTIVVLHFALAAALLVLGLLLLCAPEPDLGAVPKTAVQDAPAEGMASFMANAIGAAGSSAAGLVPVRAVFEDGKLRVEYGVAPAAKSAAVME